MRAHRYPELGLHKAVHDTIRQKTADLCRHAHLVTVANLLRFAKEWWTSHIQETDKKYAPYLEAVGSRR
jgi:hemerythrin